MISRRINPAIYHDVRSPALTIDCNTVRASIDSLTLASDRSKLLYSVKSLTIPLLLEWMSPRIDGFSVSSVFEAELAGEYIKVPRHRHFCSPLIGIRELSSLEPGDYVTFNSLSQFEHNERLSEALNCGMRVNPKYSIAENIRYDPCRTSSKTGLTMNEFLHNWRAGGLRAISGIHFHTACCTATWEPLLQTVKVIEERLAPMLHELEWINLGGGYKWDETTDFGPLQEAVDLLTNTYELEVFLEPGDGIVNSAGSLISSVVDLFERDGKMVAILDTTVNHLPEVFEYQYEPDVAEHVDGAAHEYILAGCSCLAGDLFGEYAFEEPLDIGSRITFENVGAYSLVKANMFNGINLPSIYIQREDGELELVREFTYEDFLARCGGKAYAAARAGV